MSTCYSCDGVAVSKDRLTPALGTAPGTRTCSYTHTAEADVLILSLGVGLLRARDFRDQWYP